MTVEQPALVAVAHGSRDPRSAATIGALIDEVRSRRPDLDVGVSFLDLSAPRLPDVLAGVAADGHRRAVVVPLLLGNAFHARSDVPGAVSEAARRHPRLQIATADVLGVDPGVDTAALSRLHAALTPDAHLADCHPTSQAVQSLRGRGYPCALPGGAADAADLAGPRPAWQGPPELRGPGTPCEVRGCPLRDPGLGVVLASVGSSRESANRAVAERVEGWRARFGWAAASAGYVTAAEPTPSQAIDIVRASGATRVAVVPWVLAPGRLPDRIEEAAAGADAVVAAPLGPHPALAATVIRRWAAAVNPATDVRHVG